MNTKFPPLIDKQTDKLLKTLDDDHDNPQTIINQKWDASIKQTIIAEVGEKTFDFISENITYNYNDVIVTSTKTQVDIENIDKNIFKMIVNLKRLNDFRKINKYFELVNEALPIGGVFINKVETHAVRKNRIFKKIHRPFNFLYYSLDVLLTRIFPKLKVTKGLYFFVTKGKGRVLTKAETFGRLYACGFEILKEKTIDNYLYFVARKVKTPAFDPDPTYGLLVKLKRLGKEGKIIKVYKFRTMYPFSEYLQEYIYEKNNLKDGGKINKDFRISHEGKIMRKYWIDELPMIINLIKGDMKLVGVRPLSHHYYSLYPKELQDKRAKVKPGLLPPFYADMPRTLKDIVASELKYLDAYEHSPLKTDIYYFFKILKNIIIGGKRSC